MKKFIRRGSWYGTLKASGCGNARFKINWNSGTPECRTLEFKDEEIITWCLP